MFGVALAINGSGLNLGRVYAPALVRLAIWLGLAAGVLLLFGRSPGDLATDDPSSSGQGPRPSGRYARGA
jgi:hypothetical protein